MRSVHAPRGASNGTERRYNETRIPRGFKDPGTDLRVVRERSVNNRMVAASRDSLLA